MPLTRRALTASLPLLAFPAIGRAQPAGQAIRIGEINSYTAIPSFTLSYRNGWRLAVEQINAGGGVLGRPIEVISRDDAGKPQDAVRLAGELVDEQKVDLLAGTYLSNVGLAVSDFALSRKMLFVGGEPLSDALVWEKGHRFCHRLRPSTYMQAAMLVEEAAKAAGQAVGLGRAQLRVWPVHRALVQRRPLLGDKPHVRTARSEELLEPDAGATAAALAGSQPDAILNVTFGPDLTNFVRQGSTRGLFEGRSVVSLLTGEPEYLGPLGDETPEGWIVTGYPGADVRTEANRIFSEAYRARFKEKPGMGSIVGYALIFAIAAGVAKTGSTDAERMADGFAGASFDTPFGPASFRAIDHQSTLGTFVGRTALRNGEGVMVEWHYADGANYLPPDTEVRRMRPVAG